MPEGRRHVTVRLASDAANTGLTRACGDLGNQQSGGSRKHDLSICIVTYYPEQTRLDLTVKSLGQSLAALSAARPALVVSLEIVNNGGAGPSIESLGCLPPWVEVHHARPTSNIGFGRGHNLTIERADSTYHLILNPDVELDEQALRRAVKWLDDNPAVCALAPDVLDAAGQRSFLCRRYPTVRVLLLRGFAPAWLKRRAVRLLDHYEMRDMIDGTRTVLAPPLISGCFMLWRTEVLKALKGFDPSYFLYFEDYDLSLRAADYGSLVYLPEVRIVHAGGGAARKGWRHVWMFCVSAVRFFSRHGLRW